MYRQVLVLYYMGGMSTKEIARFLGTPPDTVRQRLSRGRSKLRAEMLPTMHATFDQQKLMPIFTFRIVEMLSCGRLAKANSELATDDSCSTL